MQPARPNVLVFFTDQQRHDTTNLHGCPLDLTPNLAGLAQRGTHLRHCFTCQPVCGPARSCLQTGQYATQTGVWTTGLPLNPGRRTPAHHFNDAGYHTAYIGKWHLAPEEHRGAVPQDYQGGYQEFLGANTLELVSDAYDTRLWDRTGVERRLPGYRVDAMSDAVIDYVARDHAQPWFLFFSLLEPHHQNHRDDYPAPTGYEERYAGSWMPPDLIAGGGSAARHWPGYCGMVKRIDEALGRVLDALRSTGQLDHTIILFTSDHGCHFKTRNDEYKRSCHEASIRVPGVIAGPGFAHGGTLPHLVSLVDLPPTLLDAAGIDVPDTMSGRSLLPLVRDPAAAWPGEVLVQISETQTGRAVRTARWKYCAICPDHDERGQPVSRPHAEVYADHCLYDLMADPWEQHNLIGRESHREVVAVLRDRLTRRMAEAGESAPRFIDAPPQPAGQAVVTSAEAHA